MVLTQHAGRPLVVLTPETFPYHYGSYATYLNSLHGKQLSTKFPYHYGSYATNSEDDPRCENPLGFHTTMVLTQQ